IGTVRAAGGTSIGSFVNVVAHPDVDVARELARGGVATFARFSVMHGSVRGPAEPDERDTFAAVHDAYDMTRHTQVGSPQAGTLRPEFIERFGLVGTPETCAQPLGDPVDPRLDKPIDPGPAPGPAP